MGKLNSNGDSENHSVGQLYFFGAKMEYHPLSAKDQAKLHHFGKKVLSGIFIGYSLYPGRVWKEDLLVVGVEGLEALDASEMHVRRLNVKEFFMPNNGDDVYLP